jgi:hypothetical protein
MLVSGWRTTFAIFLFVEDRSAGDVLAGRRLGLYDSPAHGEAENTKAEGRTLTVWMQGRRVGWYPQGGSQRSGPWRRGEERERRRKRGGRAQGEREDGSIYI